MAIQVQNLIIQDSAVESLQSYILDRLSKTPMGAESVSYLVDCIRTDTRINFPTNHSFASDVFEALGFTVKQGLQIDPRRKAKQFSWAVTL
jgi:hypothetical protein